MKVLQYLLSLRPALPMSKERSCTLASNSEVRRWIVNGSVRINDERWEPEEEMPPMVWGLVFFPKSVQHRTTLV